jgi:HSP20 family molecular chaperone IbpA
VFRRDSGGRFPTAERRSEFQSVRESTYMAIKKDNVFQLAIALPGLRQRDLNVNLNCDRLTITGTRCYISTDNTARKRYKFQQTFLVDDSVDKNRLTADLKNQVLTLSVPEYNLELNEVTDESEIEKNDSIDSEESLPIAHCAFGSAESGDR